MREYINLSKGFNPFLYCRTNEMINFESLVFPGGEPHIRLLQSDEISGAKVTISCRINSFNDMGLLLLTLNAFSNLANEPTLLHLIIPYLPGSRQDRIMVSGEALTIKVYTDLINEMGFNSVTILDPHSDVGPALLDNVRIESIAKYVDYAIDDWRFNIKKRSETFSFVIPDVGASKKMYQLLKDLANAPTHVYQGEKHRDLKTGKLSGFGVNCEDFEGEDLWIVDDICDGGGTFIGLAEELKIRNAGNLYLFVTHGIFSKGVKPLLKQYSKIYTTNSIRDEYESSFEDKFTVFKIALY